MNLGNTLETKGAWHPSKHVREQPIQCRYVKVTAKHKECMLI